MTAAPQGGSGTGRAPAAVCGEGLQRVEKAEWERAVWERASACGDVVSRHLGAVLILSPAAYGRWVMRRGMYWWWWQRRSHVWRFPPSPVQTQMAFIRCGSLHTQPHQQTHLRNRGSLILVRVIVGACKRDVVASLPIVAWSRHIHNGGACVTARARPSRPGLEHIQADCRLRVREALSSVS